MQPTYLPWIGYFNLMDRSDIFVFLDSVQFEKRSWQQRNKIILNNKPHWLTIPVQTKGKYKQKIMDTTIEYNQHFPHKHLNSIYHAYHKTDFFDLYFPELKELLSKKVSHLSSLNIELITWIKEKLNIQTQLYTSGSLALSGANVELLNNICLHFSANCYLSAESSKNYIEKNNLFEKNGIELVYNDYKHPIYKQIFKMFTPYLSVIDLLFHEGPNSLQIIRSGSLRRITEDL